MEFNKCSMSKDGILLNLRKGLQAEERSKELCADLLKVLDDEQDVKIVQKILDDEVEHIRIVEELISMTEHFYINN